MDYARALRSSAKRNWALGTRLTVPMFAFVRMHFISSLTFCFENNNIVILNPAPWLVLAQKRERPVPCDTVVGVSDSAVQN